MAATISRRALAPGWQLVATARNRTLASVFRLIGVTRHHNDLTLDRRI